MLALVARGDRQKTRSGKDRTGQRSVVERGQRAVGRLQSFPILYVAIGIFILLYVFTVRAAESLLDIHFKQTVAASIQRPELLESVEVQIQRRLNQSVRDSAWQRIWGVRVNVIVIGRDGRTLIYAGSSAAVAPPAGNDFFSLVREAERLLPATAQVTVSVPHNALLANAILVGYAALLLQVLFFLNRALARREEQELAEALQTRDRTAARASEIEAEIERVRERLMSVVPAEREHAREVEQLQRERQALQKQLGALAEREEELRGKAAQTLELDQERRALEDLLEEASGDLMAKDEEIGDLQQRLRKASAGKKKPGAKASRSVELLARRLRTLYKNLEIDDHAIADIAALGDEAHRLKAEESIKRLDADADNVAVRRKVGGLPDHRSIFELSFAGKGRIYYCKGQTRRFRVLSVGGKASQKVDLEYLSRLDRETN